MSAIPRKYLGTLKGSNRKKQYDSIMRSRDAYKKSMYLKRPTFKSQERRKSSFVTKFQKRYGISSMSNRNAIFRATGVPAKVQDRIVGKGEGAFYSSGARPSQTPRSWGLARLAAVLIGGKACNVDKDLLPKGMNCNSLRVMYATFNV